MTPSRQGAVMAVGISVVMHLLMFVFAGPAEKGSVQEGASAQPYTHYSLPATDADMDEVAVRSVWSPVVFSLPTAMGFSREMLDHEVQTSKSFLQQVRNEQFLDIGPSVRSLNEEPNLGRLMVTAVDRAPVLPVLKGASANSFPPASRVMIPRALENRLVGELVLPEELNRPVEKPWLVHASIRVSKEGVVKHVLFDQPLEPASLNDLVLRWLYRLRFTPGDAIDSSLEVYSPEPLKGGEPGK